MIVLSQILRNLNVHDRVIEGTSQLLIYELRP